MFHFSRILGEIPDLRILEHALWRCPNWGCFFLEYSHFKSEQTSNPESTHHCGAIGFIFFIYFWRVLGKTGNPSCWTCKILETCNKAGFQYFEFCCSRCPPYSRISGSEPSRGGIWEHPRLFLTESLRGFRSQERTISLPRHLEFVSGVKSQSQRRYSPAILVGIYCRVCYITGRPLPLLQVRDFSPWGACLFSFWFGFFQAMKLLKYFHCIPAEL